MTDTARHPGIDGPLADALVGTRHFFTRAEVSPDKRSLYAEGGRAGDSFYADNVKFADEWLAAAPGTDGALAMAMGHVVLKEFFVDRTVDYFDSYVKTYTDLPYLVALEEYAGDSPTDGSAPRLRPGKFVTASDLHDDRAGAENAQFKPVLMDETTGRVVVPDGSLGHRFGDEGVGHWNLELGQTSPMLSVYAVRDDVAVVDLPRFDTAEGADSIVARGVPVRRLGGRLVTTVLDLMLANYGVAREGLPGFWPTGYDDAARTSSA